MEKIKILIAEDEMIIAARISMHLELLGYEIMEIVPSGEEVIEHCLQDQPDILLLDINLNGLLDGVETAILLQKEGIDIPIIYLTANSDSSTFERAKLSRPYGFVSKPYKKVDLQRTIELAVSRMAIKSGLTFKDDKNQESSYILSDRIFVRQKNKMVKLFLKDIHYVSAERSYCRIFTAASELLLSIPLKELAEKITAEHFMRVHRSFLINLLQVDEIAENHTVISKKVIPVGKSYREEFLQRIQLI